MTHLDTKVEAIGNWHLKLMLPKASAIPVASPAVGQYKKPLGVGVLDRTDDLPTIADGCHGKFGGVTACAKVDKSLIIAAKIIDAVRDSHPLSVGREIMVKDRHGLLTPPTAGLMKLSDQLAAFGINADHRQSVGSVVLNLAADVAKLLIALAGSRGISQPRFKTFQVPSDGIIHFLKEQA